MAEKLDDNAFDDSVIHLGKEKENLWKSVLSEVSDQAKKHLPSDKRLIVLGDDCSGKTNLIMKMRPPGEDELKKGAGLEYSYLDVNDEERDEHTRLNTWILDGDIAHRKLLKHVFSAASAKDILILLVADIGRPWTIIDSLEQWLRIIREHLHTLQMSAKDLNEMEAELTRKFQEYKDPEEQEEDAKSRTRFPSDSGQEAVTLPLGENVLVNNLGIPIIVAVSKTDQMSSLENEMDYKEEHFDFIQKHIRNFCLRCGAALIYTSVKESRNTSLLYKYIVHRVYGFSFNAPAQVVEKDAVFIPMGWDSESKINILNEHIKTFSANEAYGDIIVKPLPRKTASQEKEVAAEDEQAFLAAELVNLQKMPVPQQQRPQPAAELKAGQPRIPSLSPAQRPRPGLAAQKMDPTKAGVQNASEGVLANFFNSLLQKKPATGAPGKPPGASTANRSDVAAELERMAKKQGPPGVAGSPQLQPSDPE